MASIKLPFIIELVGGSDKLERAMVNTMKPVLNNAFIKAAPNIQIKLRDMIKLAIKESPEYISLVSQSGTLRGELGLVGPVSSMEVVLNIWLDSIIVKPISVRFVRAQQQLDGGISIVGIRSTMQDVVKLPATVYISENGKSVPWLDWLLLYGDQVILTDHHVKFDLNSNAFKYSRTGLALMQKGGTYRIPPEYSGIKGKNFVTRSLQSIQDNISQLVIKEVENAIK